MDDYISFNTRSFLKYSYNGKEGTIRISDVQPFVKFEKVKDCEHSTAHFENHNIIFIITTFGEQAGIVGVWDCEKNKVVHVSEGSFAREAVISDGKVWILREPYSYCSPPKLSVSCIPFGTINPDVDGDYASFGFIDKLDISIPPNTTE